MKSFIKIKGSLLLPLALLSAYLLKPDFARAADRQTTTGLISYLELYADGGFNIRIKDKGLHCKDAVYPNQAEAWPNMTFEQPYAKETKQLVMTPEAVRTLYSTALAAKLSNKPIALVAESNVLHGNLVCKVVGIALQ